MTPDRPRARPPAAPRDDGGWFAHPALSLLLAAVWLLLRQSVAPADLITAAVLGLVVPKVTHRFLGPAARPRGLATIVRFVGTVLWDIVVSNVTVARIVLSPVSDPKPAWVRVPLDTRHPTAITLLATIITMTPGTVSSIVDDEAGEILVHALDCDDPPAMAAQIKQRYERPLMEIFG